MNREPSFDDVFSVMASASVGDTAARFPIPEEAELDHVPTRFGIALNILLDDLAAASERRLQTLLDNVQDYAIIMIDADGRVASWNSGAQRVMGYSGEEIIGRSIDVFRAADERALVANELATARQHGRVEDEGWRYRRDGSRFWANVILTSIKDAHEAVVGYAKVTRDLSERRRADEALHRANEELEAFSYSVAHDLRSPLRAINGYAQLISEDFAEKIPPEGQRWLQSIRHNAEKMGGIIDGLLLLARTARGELSRASMDLVPVLNDILVEAPIRIER